MEKYLVKWLMVTGMTFFVCMCPVQANLVTNGSFEEEELAGWVMDKPTIEEKFMRLSGEKSHTGGKSLKIDTSKVPPAKSSMAKARIYGSLIPVKPSTSYAVGAWFFVPEDFGNRGVEIGVGTYDEAKKEIDKL